MHLVAYELAGRSIDTYTIACAALAETEVVTETVEGGDDSCGVTIISGFSIAIASRRHGIVPRRATYVAELVGVIKKESTAWKIDAFEGGGGLGKVGVY